MTTVYLLRHGLTRANLDNRFAGRSDEPLHPSGEAQLRELADRLRPEPISAIYCGPLARTCQSAAILARSLGLAPTVVAGLNEIHIPHWDGLSKEEIRQRFGEEYPTWLEAPERFQVAGCETIAQVQTRAVAAMEELLARHQGERLLVVSHLIVLRALLLHYQGLPISSFRRIKVANSQVKVLQHQSPGQAMVRDWEEG